MCSETKYYQLILIVLLLDIRLLLLELQVLLDMYRQLLPPSGYWHCTQTSTTVLLYLPLRPRQQIYCTYHSELLSQLMQPDRDNSSIVLTTQTTVLLYLPLRQQFYCTYHSDRDNSSIVLTTQTTVLLYLPFRQQFYCTYHSDNSSIVLTTQTTVLLYLPFRP